MAHRLNLYNEKMIRYIATLFFSALCVPVMQAQQTAAVPERTLRIDYQFSGNNNSQHISISELSSFKGWAGRTARLDSLPLRGNGDICMRSIKTGKVLYCQSFSTLFQEWLTTEEATRTSRSFENSFLLPMPKEAAEVTVRLYSFKKDGQAITLTHEVRPDDILIRNLDNLPVTPHRFLHRSGSPIDKIDVAIVAEGYTASQSDQFYAAAHEAVDAILSHEPFKTYADRFNFVAVAAASQDSDVSIPKERLWRHTALSSHFSTFYFDRYLTTLRQRDLHNLLVGIPYEHIIILANTHTYGGGGIYNSYTLTTTHHADYRPVVVHEFGHSFAGLADEYYYDDQYVNYYYPDVEPWEQNISTLCDFNLKWRDMLPQGTLVPTKPDSAKRNSIGVYEGGGYMSKGVYRGYQDCRMKTNEYPAFCPVCQRAISRLIDFYTTK